MLPKSPPYRLYKYANRYMRKIAYTPPQWNPAVVLKTTVEAQELLLLTEEKEISLNVFLVKALAIALTRYPRLNYLTLWGDMIWAGDHTKIGVVREEKPLEEVSQFIVEDAEAKALTQIQQEFEKARHETSTHEPNAFLLKIMDRFPYLFYQVGRRSGLIAKSTIDTCAPVMLSNLNMPGVDEMITAGVPYAILINPSTINDKKLPINLSFNHQLANARAVAAYLIEVKALLEHPSQLVTDEKARSVDETQ